MTEMTSNTLRCHICSDVLADNESTIKHHISSIHLKYLPYNCRTCKKEGYSFKAATKEGMESHIAFNHSATNSGYNKNKDQIKKKELKSAIEECRRISILQISSADTTIVRDQNSALNRPTDCGENVRVAPETKEKLRRVFILLGGTSNDTGNISTEVKQENPETSHHAALEVIQPETEQNHNANKTSPEAMQNLTDRPALNDCQATLLPDYDRTSVINEVPTENQEIALNVDLSRLTSINLYPSATSSDRVENKYEINTSGQIHGTIEKVQDSNVTRTGMTTGKHSKNGTTQLSEQNETHTAVNSNASGKIRATGTSTPIPTVLKRAEGPNKHLGSKASKSPIVPQEPPRKRLKIRTDFDTDHELAVERKRDRLSHDAGAKRSVDGEKRFKCEQWQVQDSNATRTSMTTGKHSKNGTTKLSEQNEIHTAVDPNASGKIRATATSMPIPTEISPLKRTKGPNKHLGSRASKSPIVPQEPPRKSLKIRRDFDTGHELAVERKRDRLSRDAGASWPIPTEISPLESAKVPNKHLGSRASKSPIVPQEPPRKRLKIYRDFDTGHELAVERKRGGLSHDAGAKRSVDGVKRFKCERCDYATNHKSDLPRHMTSYTGEKPYKCKDCTYAAAQISNLIIHQRSHSGEKPFKCQSCDYATARKGDLDSHILSHTGEKPFKCTVCNNYAAARSGDLTKHIRTHTGEQPYKCRFCPFKTAYPRTLNNHVRTKHMAASKLNATNSKKNTARKMLKKSGKYD